MALLRNKKNPNITKDIKGEYKIAMYLGTNEWELDKKIIQPEPKIKDKITTDMK